MIKKTTYSPAQLYNLSWSPCRILSCPLPFISLFLSLPFSPPLSLATITVHRSRPLKLRCNFSVTRIEAPWLVIRHTCITGTSSRQASALALIHRQHPLALLIIRGLGIRAGRQVILNFFFLSLDRIIRFLGLRSDVGISNIPSPDRDTCRLISPHHRHRFGTLTHIHQLASAPSNLVVFLLCLIAF